MDEELPSDEEEEEDEEDYYLTEVQKKVSAIFIFSNIVASTLEMVFCYQNCSDLLGEKIVLVIKKNF